MAARNNKTVSLEINTSTRRKHFKKWGPLRADLVRDGWKTPDTYGGEFAEIPSEPGVYLLAVVDTSLSDENPDISGFVAYVGMSRNLIKRLTCHPVRAKLNKLDLYCQAWFKPEQELELRETERKFIRAYDPPFNLSGKAVGLVSQ